MGKLLTVLAFILFGLVCGAAFAWGMWSIYCWIAPQLWPTGPEHLLHPTLGVFSVTLFFVLIIGKAMFGGRS
jgi:hypothetical protein